ncbi:hypothetical protein EJ04DRAFT_590723 [Polyplosphaeria fusca]|uniref:Uncharacterized protein n=1 Tax=Polyplosphaeria fusca TaxID=682080 RepID=A0A9P4QPV6_9PLEO|nr:hypothetical protein EJ04DRAFT_590723 [Polyplosphaeria fusca]
MPKAEATDAEARHRGDERQGWWLNGTSPTKTAAPPPGAGVLDPDKTPATIPTPVYQSVTVVPADRIAQTSGHAQIPSYTSSAKLLNGYCETPAYTILDGPTAVWVPVIGCISSKSDCCITTTTSGSGPASTDKNGKPVQDPAGNGGAGGFPISKFPDQGTITGCPKDYHTVGGTACCPKSYWLWSTELGGQVPCYSSLDGTMVVPPMPDTLAHGITGTSTPTGSTSKSSKPTSAIVNIAYAMQYPVVAPPPKKEALPTNAKIGIGVGAPVVAVIVGVLVWVLVRRVLAGRKAEKAAARSSVGERFGQGVDTSYVAHHPSPGAEPSQVQRSYGGAKYSSVSTRPTDAHF